MDRYEAYIEKLKKENNLRVLRKWSRGGAMLNLSSNDYLGLASRKDLWHKFFEGLSFEGSKYKLSASSSRLLSGNHLGYDFLEKLITEAYGREGCLVFGSGYQANVGIVPALCGKDDLILADKLVHASIIDGIRLSRAKYVRYGHLDYQHLESLLVKYREKYKNVFILTESIFSMDGDVIDLTKLVHLKHKYDALLYVDEAHAIGVRGVGGLGIVEEQKCINEVDFIVGTFGKALASQGAFVVCSNLFREYLINTARTLIYATALPPISIYWTGFIFGQLESFRKERECLQQISNYLREKLMAYDFEVLGDSHIITLVLGDNDMCVDASNRLINKGIFVLPIRPPTVPVNTARLRFSLSPNVSKENVKEIVKVIKKC